MSGNNGAAASGDFETNSPSGFEDIDHEMHLGINGDLKAADELASARANQEQKRRDAAEASEASLDRIENKYREVFEVRLSAVGITLHLNLRTWAHWCPILLLLSELYLYPLRARRGLVARRAKELADQGKRLSERDRIRFSQETLALYSVWSIAVPRVSGRCMYCRCLSLCGLDFARVALVYWSMFRLGESSRSRFAGSWRPHSSA